VAGAFCRSKEALLCSAVLSCFLIMCIRSNCQFRVQSESCIDASQFSNCLFVKLMEVLALWLLFVASMRLLSMYLGYFNFNRIKTNVYVGMPAMVTPLCGRIFAQWTSLSFMLCVLCAYDLANATMFIATFMSFVFAVAHFSTEVFIYKTTVVGVNGALIPFIIAGTFPLQDPAHKRQGSR
jgi:hypothetical protein